MMLEKYGIKAEIVEFEYIGSSGGYDFVHIKQKNIFRNGQFKGTVVELVHSFKKHEDKWKFWSIMQLSMEVIK